MKRIFAILMACLFMVAVMAVIAAPAFADPPKKKGNQNGCCIVKNDHVTVKKTGNGTQVKHT